MTQNIATINTLHLKYSMQYNFKKKREKINEHYKQ